MADDDLPPLIDIARGRYRHYKGGEYEVLDTLECGMVLVGSEVKSLRKKSMP